MSAHEQTDKGLRKFQVEGKQKVYILKQFDKRFNSKTFQSYEEARKYARRLITKKFGGYRDNISEFGFSIAAR